MLSIKQAREILRSATEDQKSIMQKSYDNFLVESWNAYEQERQSNAHQIKTECLAYGIENELWDSDFANRLWESFEVMGFLESAAAGI